MAKITYSSNRKYLDYKLHDNNIFLYTDAFEVKDSVNTLYDIVFNLSNTVVAACQVELSTTSITEGTNLYFTDARVSLNQNVINGQTAFSWGNHSGLYIPLSQKGVANGVATLNSSGVISGAELPSLILVDTFIVGSEAAMLALSSAEQGDVAIRTDIHKTFILANNTPSGLVNWKEMLSPTDAVSTVNGYNGNVVLSTSDINEGSRLYYTDTRVKTYSDTLYASLTGYNKTNWDTAFTNSHTHSNKTFLDGITGALGSNAYTSTSYLPTAGGTLTGGLTGTTASFSGTVGIGRTPTTVAFEVQGSTHSYGDIYAQRGTNMIGITNWSANANNSTLYAASDIYISPNIANAFIFKTTGNLLINTTTDSGYKLDVNGTTRITGALTLSTITSTYIPKSLNGTLVNSTAYFTSDGLNVKETNSALYSSFTAWNNDGTSAIQLGIYNTTNANANRAFLYGGGNTIAIDATIAGVKRLIIDATGINVTGTANATQYKVTAMNTAPASATATGTVGEIRYTSTYIYVCTATNTWVRSPLTTW